MGRKKYLEKNNISQEKIAGVIKGSCGIISVIAKKLNIDWHTADKILKSNEIYQQLIDEEKEKVLDKSESNIIEAIYEKDIAVSKWYLDMFGQKRGYHKIDEVKIKHEGEIENKINLDKIDDKRIAKIFRIAMDNPTIVESGKIATDKSKVHKDTTE